MITAEFGGRTLGRGWSHQCLGMPVTGPHSKPAEKANLLPGLGSQQALTSSGLLFPTGEWVPHMGTSE